MKLSKILFSIISISVFCSCNKSFTTVSPSNTTLADSALTSVSNVRSAVAGLYSGLANTSYYGETAVLLPDLTADNVYRSVQTGARYTAWATQTVTNGDSYAQATWDQMYSIIINANTIINKAPLLHPSSATTDSLELRGLIGEAYAVRALTFFDLTRFFCYSYTKITDTTDYGVPLVLNSYAENLNQVFTQYTARSTTEQSYAQVMNDIDSALLYLPSNSNGKILSNGVYDPTLFRIRMNYYSVNALAARVCLYKKDYPHAITYANVVINNPLYSLLPALTMTTDFHTQSNNESIFEVANNEYNNQGANSIGYEFNQNGYGEMLAPDTMWKIYDSLDVRRGFMTQGNRNAFGGETNTLIINKYNNITNFAENIKVFRLAEMYLIRSEAKAYLNGSNAGIPDILTVANARNEITTPITSAASSMTTFVPLILLENRKEFAFEGHRIFDLTRISNPNYTDHTHTFSYYHYTKQKLTYTYKTVNGVRDSTLQLSRSGVMSSSLKKYAIMPIPYTDIKDNPLLVQNLNY